MTLEATYKHEHELRKWPATADHTPGQVVLTPEGLVGVIQGNDAQVLKTGDLVTARVRGVVALASASGTTISVGAVVHWDDTANLAIAAAGDFIAGRAVKAKVSGETEVLCSLNETVKSS